tara:strand:+ start:53 stop:277 length:225 start_codon:yes stop_codon:yes gene_type:complete
MTESNLENQPILTFDGVKYQIENLSDNSKKLLEGMKVADGQIKLQTDNLKVLEVGRQSMGLQLKELLKNEKPME